MNQLYAPRFALYFEDVPAQADPKARGLSVVNESIFKSFAYPVDVYINSMYGVPYNERYCAVPKRSLVRSSKIFRILDKAIAKIAPPNTAVVASRELARKRPQEASALFFPVGADPMTIGRGAGLAQLLSLRHSCYLVDDFRKSGFEELPINTRRRIINALQRAEAVYCITVELAQDIAAFLGRECQALDIPQAEELDNSDSSSEARSMDSLCRRDGNYVLHIGAVNHIYKAGLEAVAHAILEVRTENGIVLDLMLTSRDTQTFDHLVVTRRPDVSSAELASLIKNSVATVVPVLGEASGMYRTSFPSKLLQYLRSSERIIAFGPSDAAAVSYLKRNGLPFVCETHAELRSKLLELVETRPDYSALYRSCFARNHSLNAFSEKIHRGPIE